MAAGDGKYITLAELKLYGLGAVADPNNPTIYNSAVQGTPDDGILKGCIQRAEMEIDRISGIQFDEATTTDAQGFTPFIDGNGNLHIWAHEHAPVTNVSSIEIRDMRGVRAYTAMTFNADDVIYPVNDGYAHPDCAQVIVIPTTPMSARGTGEIYVRWTYIGGFNPIPQSFKAMVQRLSWFVYKQREMPLNKIVNADLGIMQIPLKIPPDIDADIRLWQPVYS